MQQLKEGFSLGTGLGWPQASTAAPECQPGHSSLLDTGNRRGQEWQMAQPLPLFQVHWTLVICSSRTQQ